MSPRALIARVRALPPSRLDALLAAVVLAETQLEAALVPSGLEDRLTAHAVGVVAALVVLLHRRATWVAFLLAQTLFLGGQASGEVVTERLVLPLFVVLFASVSAAVQISGRRFWLVPLTTATTGIVALSIDGYEDSVVSVLWMLIFFTGATALGGRLLDSRLRLQRALREKADRLEAERVQRAERAALDERARIAGELHDVISHALSGMVVQAAGARRLAERGADGDLDLARASFGAIETSGRDALAELRRLLGVLRREDEELALAPVPSLAHVEALTGRVSAAGLPVRLTVEGEPVPLPAGVDVTAYRVVQEALSAALDGSSAGRADVVVRYRTGAVELEVSDDGRGDERRLTGMHERVRIFGGDVHVARPRDGGHALRARLPVEALA